MKPKPDGRPNRLRAVREAEGLSLRYVAGRLGIQPGHLSSLERGLREPQLALAMRLAGFYRRTVEEVWDYPGGIPTY